MQQEIIEKLNEIVGKTFNYKGKNITIDKYKEVGVTNTVIFAPSPMNFLNSEIPAFLESLFDPTIKEKTDVQVLVPKKELVLFEPTKENSVIKETLMDTLKKLKEDPNYLPQAKAICEVVGVMVDVQKNEIQMLSVLNKFK